MESRIFLPRDINAESVIHISVRERDRRPYRTRRSDEWQKRAIGETISNNRAKKQSRASLTRGGVAFHHLQKGFHKYTSKSEGGKGRGAILTTIPAR